MIYKHYTYSISDTVIYSIIENDKKAMYTLVADDKALPQRSTNAMLERLPSSAVHHAPCTAPVRPANVVQQSGPGDERKRLFAFLAIGNTSQMADGTSSEVSANRIFGWKRTRVI